MNLPRPDRGKKTASGHFSTSADVLENMRGKHPVVDLMLENRELGQTEIHLCGCPAAAGQPANRAGAHLLQPDRRGDRPDGLIGAQPAEHPHPHRPGTQVREGFIAAPGCVLLSVDYSQIELRIVAHMSK